MSKLTEAQRAKLEAARDLGDEILTGLKDLAGCRVGRRSTAASFPLVRAREKSGLTQAKFATLLGVSVRTVQDWEQGRREPNAAAKTLLRVAELHPTVLKRIAA